MTAEELQSKEKEEFLIWRRNLAIFQEESGLLLTPYEKNLDFWRQLWRVVERRFAKCLIYNSSCNFFVE